jgi:hypothetical protein
MDPIIFILLVCWIASKLRNLDPAVIAERQRRAAILAFKRARPLPVRLTELAIKLAIFAVVIMIIVQALN